MSDYRQFASTCTLSSFIFHHILNASIFYVQLQKFFNEKTIRKVGEKYLTKLDMLISFFRVM